MLYLVEAGIEGKKRVFTVDAPDRRGAAEQVMRRFGSERAVLMRVVPAPRPAPRWFWKAVGPRDLELFCRRLRVLLGAGVTVLDALEELSGQSEKKALALALKGVADDVRAGLSLAAAFGARPQVFPEVFTHAMVAAEESGAMEEAAGHLAEHFGREARLRGKVKQAMTYPLVVAGFAMLVAAGLFTFVVPKFAALLGGSGVPLPLITRVVMGISGQVPYLVTIGPVFLVLCMFLFRRLWRGERFRMRVEALVVRLPLVGRLLLLSAAARVCRAAGLMLGVGVPVVRALEVAGGSAVFLGFQKEMREARTFVQGGGSISAALEGSRWMPPTAIKMVAVGEASGEVDEMLAQAAELFDQEADFVVQKLPVLVEACMLLVVGACVLFVLLSLFLPMFSMYQAVGG